MQELQCTSDIPLNLSISGSNYVFPVSVFFPANRICLHSFASRSFDIFCFYSISFFLFLSRSVSFSSFLFLISLHFSLNLSLPFSLSFSLSLSIPVCLLSVASHLHSATFTIHPNRTKDSALSLPILHCMNGQRHRVTSISFESKKLEK